MKKPKHRPPQNHQKTQKTKQNQPTTTQQHLINVKMLTDAN